MIFERILNFFIKRPFPFYSDIPKSLSRLNFIHLPPSIVSYPIDKELPKLLRGEKEALNNESPNGSIMATVFEF